jgi:hypothetical protein
MRSTRVGGRTLSRVDSFIVEREREEKRVELKKEAII